MFSTSPNRGFRGVLGCKSAPYQGEVVVGGGAWGYFDAKLGSDVDSFGVFLVVIGGARPISAPNMATRPDNLSYMRSQVILCVQSRPRHVRPVVF